MNYDLEFHIKNMESPTLYSIYRTANRFRANYIWYLNNRAYLIIYPQQYRCDFMAVIDMLDQEIKSIELILYGTITDIEFETGNG